MWNLRCRHAFDTGKHKTGPLEHLASFWIQASSSRPMGSSQSRLDWSPGPLISPSELVLRLPPRRPRVLQYLQASDVTAVTSRISRVKPPAAQQITSTRGSFLSPAEKTSKLESVWTTHASPRLVVGPQGKLNLTKPVEGSSAGLRGEVKLESAGVNGCASPTRALGRTNHTPQLGQSPWREITLESNGERMGVSPRSYIWPHPQSLRERSKDAFPALAKLNWTLGRIKWVPDSGI